MTKKVEDPISEAMYDLENRIIRTVNDPLKHFVDCPLYLLKCIRWAQNYNLKLAQDIKNMYKNEAVLGAFENLNKDQIMEEFGQILTDENFEKVGLKLLNELQMLTKVFGVESKRFNQQFELDQLRKEKQNYE
jgi:tRNA nucleotidyltransferase (CCA-adding enzyme)